MTTVPNTHSEQSEIIVKPRGELSVMEMIQAVAANPDKITAESVGVMRELVGLKREMDKDQAGVAFNRAFVALQKDLRPVAPMRVVNNAAEKGGRERYRFASLSDIMEEVGPLLDKHGFVVTFTSKSLEQGRIQATCTLIHTDGHERSSDFAVLANRGAPGCSDAQIAGGALTFAKRYSLCALLNIQIDADNDARLEGETISAEEAANLEARAKAVGAETGKVLKLAGAGLFTEIRRSKYTVVANEISKMEAAAKKPMPAAIAIPEPPCNFNDPGDWRSAMLEAMHLRGFEDPARSFDRACKAGEHKSYLSVPVESRGKAWAALHTGKLDQYK